VTHVSTVCIHRDIDVPSGDLHDIVEKLSELSERECRADDVHPVDDQALEYSATVDVFDVPGGRVLVRWTASLPVPDGRTDAVKALRDAVFRDFVDELRRQVDGAAGIGWAS